MRYHLAVWHMDGLPADGGTQISDNDIVETRSGQAATLINGNVVFSAPGLLGSSVLLDGGDNGVAFDSFLVLPPLGANVSQGSISVIVGPINVSGSPAMIGRGCGLAICGHVWFMGRATGSLGFDGASAHMTLFDGDSKVGMSRPSNPSTAGGFVAATGAAGFDQTRFNVITTTWTANRVDVTSTRIDGSGQVVLQQTSAVRDVAAFGVTNFVLGVAEQNNNGAAGAFGGTIDELRVSASTRSPQFVRAEALSHLERLLVFGNAVVGP